MSGEAEEGAARKFGPGWAAVGDGEGGGVVESKGRRKWRRGTWGRGEVDVTMKPGKGRIDVKVRKGRREG
jgi:hypothetical protein